jgi:mannose-6-phosphate isomerase-like protein (cupin superfamily)
VIEAGTILTNPVTKERMTFLKTAQETNGEYVLIELHAEPGAVVAAAHVHPTQTETFEVVKGRLGAKVGRTTVEVGAGEVFVAPPKVAHKWWNAGEECLVFRCEVRPALEFERLIETMFSLAADGKTNEKGMPNPLRLAVIAAHHFDDVQLPLVPTWMQKAALALGAPRWKVIFRIVLPTALPGIITGSLLAVARAAGETAPLLFTAAFVLGANADLSQRMNSLPLQIFNDVGQAQDRLVQRAWGAALTLVVLVLALTLLARLIQRRSKLAA